MTGPSAFPTFWLPEHRALKANWTTDTKDTLQSEPQSVGKRGRWPGSGPHTLHIVTTGERNTLRLKYAATCRQITAAAPRFKAPYPPRPKGAARKGVRYRCPTSLRWQEVSTPNRKRDRHTVMEEKQLAFTQLGGITEATGMSLSRLFGLP